MANLTRPITIDRSFVRLASGTGPTSQRFRFSSPCEEKHCGHWSGQKCGLIGQLRRAADSRGLIDDAGSLPVCAIRNDCRWWQQLGRKACEVCSLVVTDQEAAPGR